MMTPQIKSEQWLDEFFQDRKDIDGAVHWACVKAEVNYLRTELDDLREVNCIDGELEDEEQ